MRSTPEPASISKGSISDGLAALAARPALAPLRRVWTEIRRPIAAPPRVASAIAETETVAEILVAWVQLAGVALFLAIYALSYGAFEMRRGLEPVPLALLAYGGFVLWRMRLAYAGRLGPALLTLSASVDVAVLMGLIWSFTLQYHAPAALYLKAPTLFYAFILIALRALRYDAKHVLLTGALVALGWAALVLLAARDAPTTSDYPTYMTSLSILWGAEAEKIVAVLGVTAVLALAVSRARTLLVRTVVEETAARDLSRFLDADAAARVRSADMALKAGDGELKSAAIMFLDLRGFSLASAALPPKDVIGVLQEYQSRFVPIVEAAGGAVDKYLGDGILVSFGTGARAGRACADAFAAIPALLEAADAWAVERQARGAARLDVAVAITHGPVVHGVIGHDDRLEFTVIGDAVNLAAKLEKHAKLEQARVIATRDAMEAARAQGSMIRPMRDAPGARVEGVAAPIDLVVLA